MEETDRLLIQKLQTQNKVMLEALQNCVRYFVQHRNGGFNGMNLLSEKDSAYDKSVQAIKTTTT